MSWYEMETILLLWIDIPYVGEFVYDRSIESSIQNGVGYIISKETRITTQ